MRAGASKCKCNRRIKCTASESNASANAQQLNQMQMHLDQMQIHFDQMQMYSASDILLNYLVTTINKKNTNQ